ncbi:RNA polymerase I-specific transcription initiation factor RRN3 [Phascolomyces articulosus]|uniref:RNA polymerase I-specific transcription initiation factor RRN3 n=1 Tax=Phascolomyces articulosus TaxID=60185 RepID=A0AAD5JN18_9FUNG|nr:RNA polymerase I-specific transcription initiation factor RRN3 [Phascolomyces articulosus]
MPMVMDAYRDPEIDETSIENVSRAKLTNTKMIMKTFVTGALKEKEQGNPKRYDELVSLLLTDPNHVNAPSTLKLYLWIQILSENVSRLDKSCATLVEAILDIDWGFRETKFAEVYVAFLEHLVTAHAFYVVPVLRQLVKGFSYRPVVPSYAKVARSEVYKRNHTALQSVLKLIPTSVMPLYEAIVAYIPKQRENSASQAAYIRNILDLINYVPYLRKQVLMLLITHMIQFDAHIQIELDELQEDVELQEFKLDFDADYASDDSDDEYDSDQEDVEDDDEFDPDGYHSDDETEKRDSEEKRKQKIESMTRKLDAMMLLLLRYLSNFAMEGASPSERTDLFNTLITIFDSTVVKTLKSRYTQFLIFYFCSIDVNAYPELFLNHLLEHMMDSARPGITRISCAMYVASYVARAKFLDVSSIQRSVNVLSAWCNDYMDHHEFRNTQPDASKYDMFYAAMQAIMYIFCFRWRELISEEGLDELVEESADMVHHQSQTKANSFHKGNQTIMKVRGEEDATVETVPLITIGAHGDVTRNWCVGLKNLPRLISSRLNPLKVCSDLVVNQFAHVARTTNFMYVHPIIQRNKKIVLSGMGHNTNLQAVQSFFPFDPYKLKTSSPFIDNIYSVWRGDNDEEDDYSSDDDSSEDGDDESSSSSSEDEEIMTGMSAMSISPAHPHLLL